MHKDSAYIETTILSYLTARPSRDLIRAAGRQDAGRLHGGVVMYKDEIVEEVRRVKEEHAAEYGYDIEAMCRALREKQKKNGRKVVSPALRRAVEP